MRRFFRHSRKRWRAAMFPPGTKPDCFTIVGAIQSDYCQKWQIDGLAHILSDNTLR